MGVSLDEIAELISELDFRKPPNVLDIGTQNLYRADADRIVAAAKRARFMTSSGYHEGKKMDQAAKA